MNRERCEWDEEKIQYLKNNWNKTALYKLAIELHSIPETLSKKAKELGLEEYKSNRWSEEDVLRLRELSTEHVYKDIAVMLGKSELAVYKKAEKLGIKLILGPIIWTEEKDKYLLENYDKMGITELGDNLGISYSRIITRLKKFGIEWETKNWKDEEIEILKKMAPTCHYTEIAKVLNRSVGAIGYKAFDLGIKTISEYRKFSGTEKGYVKENWDKMTVVGMARYLKCSLGQLYRLKKELNLSDKGQKIKWDYENLNLLRQLAKTTSIAELAKQFKTTNTAIITIAHKNNIVLLDSKINWSEEQIEKLKELAKTMTLDQISRKMKKPSYSIRTQADKLGIKLINNSNIHITKRWTKEEIVMLKELLKTHTTIEIAKKMDKTEDAVYVKAKKLGLEILDIRKRWTNEEEEQLSDMWGSKSIEYIAQKLNRTSSAITNRAYVLNLGSSISNNYDGLTIQELCDLFGKNRQTISVIWVSLGLKFTKKRVSARKTYSIVAISDLFEFLEKHQDIWDSRVLEKNILGKEPKWLAEKRKSDIGLSESSFSRMNINKAQLIAEGKYFLELAEEQKMKDATRQQVEGLEPQIQLVKNKAYDKK